MKTHHKTRFLKLPLSILPVFAFPPEFIIQLRIKAARVLAVTQNPKEPVSSDNLYTTIPFQKNIMLKLTPAQRRAFREQAHDLNPVVMIGDAGLTEGVLKEISNSLDAHGLIKIRVFGDDRANRIDIYQAVCAELNAAPIQHIGKLLVIYRPKKEKTATASGNTKSRGIREVKTIRPGSGSVRNRVKKVTVKGNERVTAGGKIKRAKARQASAKKKSLS